MSKNRYLYEDVRDLKEAWNDLMQPVLKLLESVLDWLLASLNRIKGADCQPLHTPRRCYKNGGLSSRRRKAGNLKLSDSYKEGYAEVHKKE